MCFASPWAQSIAGQDDVIRRGVRAGDKILTSGHYLGANLKVCLLQGVEAELRVVAVAFNNEHAQTLLLPWAFLRFRVIGRSHYSWLVAAYSPYTSAGQQPHLDAFWYRHVFIAVSLRICP
jgi:hypothetical protein